MAAAAAAADAAGAWRRLRQRRLLQVATVQLPGAVRQALEDQQLDGWRNSLWTPLLEKCGKQRAWQEATDLLNVARCHGAIPSSYMLNLALRAVVSSVAWKVALDLLFQAEHRNSVSFNTTGLALASAKQWAHGLALLGAQRQVRIPLDVISYNTLQHGLAGGSCWRLTLHLLKTMGSPLQPDDATYSAAIVACGRALQLSQVLRLAMLGGLSSRNAAISILTRSRQPQAHREALQLADSLGDRQDVVTHTSLAHTIPAQDLLVSLRQKRLEPNRLTLRALRSSARRGSARSNGAGEPPGAWALALQHLPSDHAELGALALGCARAHRWRAALGCAAPRALGAQMAAGYACQAAGRWQLLAPATHRAVLTAGTESRNLEAQQPGLHHLLLSWYLTRVSRTALATFQKRQHARWGVLDLLLPPALSGTLGQLRVADLCEDRLLRDLRLWLSFQFSFTHSFTWQMADAQALERQERSLEGEFGGTADGSLSGTHTWQKPQGDKQHENFRYNNVRFLQEQNKDATKALDRVEEERDEAFAAIAQWEEKRLQIQSDFGKLQQELAETEEKCNVSAAEIHKRDEQIRVLSEQNRSLLDMLEQEELTVKERQTQIAELSATQAKLQKISDDYNVVKATGNQQLLGAYNEIAKFEEELRNAQSETGQLKEAERNFAAQAKADIEALEVKLRDSKDMNVQYLQQIQHNEVFEHRLAEAINRLRETLDELTVQKKGIKMQLDMDAENRDKWMQSKAEVERRKDGLEKMVDALRQALRGAEEQNTRMQEENKAGSDNFRQLGDKVYALMDQLRQHQTDLKKTEAGGVEKQKKIGSLEKQSQNLQQQLQMEVDAKLSAEAEARNAAQMQALLQKKNKMLEEALQLALKAQEKVEKRLLELKEKTEALQTQNDYLGTRIDGNEEDKGALRYDLRRTEDELRQATAVNGQLLQKRVEVEDRFNEVEAEKVAVKAELDYIKREDMLDETGRTKPILIESESKLIERLQINEFLYSSQQARNPVPMLVEKISHLLEMLHTTQVQSDMYLQDLQRSNSMLQGLRDKNKNLYEKVQMCETWKMRALLKIASNEFEMRSSVKGHKSSIKEGNALYLDGLQYSNKEIGELKKLIQNYMKEESVKEIRLQDNNLDKTAVPLICELMDLCPYLTKLDLRRNRLDNDALADLQGFVERIPGVTTLVKDPVSGDLRARSGNQVRLVILLEDQSPPDPEAPPSPTADLTEDQAGLAADGFLSSAAGVTSQGRLQGPDGPSGGTTRTMAVPQKPGGAGKPLGDGTATTLPPIS
eukprot:s2158_g1.t1